MKNLKKNSNKACMVVYKSISATNVLQLQDCSSVLNQVVGLSVTLSKDR